MYQWGAILIAIGALSFLLPLFGRQFILVSLLGVSGVGSAAAGFLLVVVGVFLLATAKRGERKLEHLQTTPQPQLSENSVTRESHPLRPNATIKAIAFCVVVGLFTLLVVHGLSSSTTPSSPVVATYPDPRTESPAPTLSLAERLRQPPPLATPVAGGIANYLSAIETDQQLLRLFVDFKPKTKKSLLNGSVAKALLLLQQPLCEQDGLFSRFGLEAGAVTLIVYENRVRVGEIPVPSTLCA